VHSIWIVDLADLINLVEIGKINEEAVVANAFVTSALTQVTEYHDQE